MVIAADGKDFAKEPVRNGLTRIYGSKTTQPSGGSSKAYVAELNALEKEAKTAKRGGGQEGNENAPCLT